MILRTENLVKKYGARLVNDHISYQVAQGEIVGLLGPNGAGKTTLIGQLGGELQPDSGDIFLQGERVTTLPAADRALRGLARSYQISSAFPEFTVLESVALAKQAHGSHSFGAWRALLKRTHLVDAAEHAIAKAGLRHRISQRVSELAHGERRQLELAMVLVSQPKVLLLDEPMAGMSHQESMKVVDLLAGLKGQYTLLLVEHDMDVVFTVCDRITVLNLGALHCCSRASRKLRQNYVQGPGAYKSF